MATITPQVQAAIDSLAAALGLENPDDTGSVASWKRTLADYTNAPPGSYYFSKVSREVAILRADPSLDQTMVERLAKFLGVP